MAIPDQTFSCVSTAALMSKVGKVIAIDHQKATLTWWSPPSIPGGVATLQHHLKGRKYIAWLSMEDDGPLPHEGTEKEIYTLEYMISKTMDALHTTFAQGEFWTINASLPHTFGLAAHGTHLHFLDGSYLTFGLDCDQVE